MLSSRASSSASQTSKAALHRLMFSTPSRSLTTSRPLHNATMKVKVDGKEIEVPSSFTVLQACEQAGATIPRFCYHDRLSIAGNCRMCLVEVEKAPKPVASCAFPLMPNMVIKTDTPLVKKAREGVMEFLLANHPLDCPICDQGGECDLQDQSLYFGGDRSRFREHKRTVEDKNLGPLVKTVMTRCIHCTRCIRFTTELGGIATMGATGRGNHMEIGTYVSKLLDTEMSGNVIDLCPVGALTSKPFAFTSRPWELIKTESVDVHDAVGANIRVDTRGPEVMRILPRLHEEVNEEWIADKSRFSYDGLKRQRLDTPLKKDEATGEFKPISWPEALLSIKEHILANNITGGEVLGVAGDLADAEAIISFKDLLNRLGSSNLLTANHVQARNNKHLSADSRKDYVFNPTIAGVDTADVVLIIGSNIRMEAPLIATRLRRNANSGVSKVFNLGPAADLNFNHTELGNNPAAVLADLAAGKGDVAAALKGAKRPLVVVGMSALGGAGGQAVSATLSKLSSVLPNLRTAEWDGLAYLHTAASRVAAQDLGFVPGPNAFAKPARLVYLLGAEEFPVELASAPFVIYQGSHGDVGAERANLILPSPAYTEKSATYVNLEGRVQRTRPAVGRLAQSREDWAIFRALSEILNVKLPYDTIEQVRERLVDVSPTFATLDTVEKASSSVSTPVNTSASLPSSFAPWFSNYFMTDVISRASKTMAKCSAQLVSSRNSYVDAAHNPSKQQRA